MTKIALLLVIRALLLAASPADDIRSVLDRQEQAWNHGDLDDLLTAYEDSPNLVFISRKVSRGLSEIRERYRTTYGTKEKMGTLKFSDLDVRMLGTGYATVIGRFHLDREEKGGGPAQGIFTLIFRSTPSGWKIIQDHTS